MPCYPPSIWPQIIGPCAALAGVLIGLWYASREKEKERVYQRKILLRSKYEELAHALSESVSHAQELLTVDTTLSLFLKARPALAQKIDVLARLYFSELMPLTEEYLLSVTALQTSLAESFDPSSSLNVGEQGTMSENVNKAKNNMMNAKHALDEAIDKYADKYAAS